ncbi:helix-turn-helix domain-containing protein [Microbacterium esteraromaticum]|uniref:helix-turn-helix domain-containing protein n=1 Tax=Microbacterium esteraromaticum TaxID=57043 RepID=UPI00195F0829|nr:helix-turn-helix domain-containing protein [Microbacterium esteraromaticum]MBM7465135.1 DNA-binding transcriptional ArsR family regulator [Microbacterium esteraromaticum]
MSEDGDRGIRLDERQIRVLAHPLRARIPGLLRMRGPATATDLARLLDTNSGATSYHLRQLAEVGLVTDTGEGVGRRREWRATSDFHSWSPSDFDDRPDAAAAVGWLQRAYLRDFVERAERWEEAAPDWSAEWRDALGLSDTVVEVTPEQARAMHAELAEVLGRYRTIGAGGQDAIRLHVTTHAAPLQFSSAARSSLSAADPAGDEAPSRS